MRKTLGGVGSAIVTVVMLFSVNDGLLRAALNMKESNRRWEERHQADPNAIPVPKQTPPTMRDRFNNVVLETTKTLVNLKRQLEGAEPLNADPPNRPQPAAGIQANPF